MQGSSTGTKRYGVSASDFLRTQLFYAVDVLANGGDPVRADGFVHPTLLLTVHGGRREPNSVVKRRNTRKARIIQKIHHRSPQP